MSTSSVSNEELCRQIVACITRADRDSALELMREWGETHAFDRLAEDVLIPVLNVFSEEHAAEDEAPIARGYVAAKVAEASMEMIAERTSNQPTGPAKGPVVIGNIEDDFHALGRRIVGTFLKADGWEVEDMGNDVLAAEFVDRAVEIGARVIGVSAMMYTTAQGIRSVREELDRRGLSGRVKLAVGGAVFILRPELVDEVGGDGSAKTAVGAPELFERLLADAGEEGVL